MELGATPNVASTWLFLVKIGVPIDTVSYFMNQPIIRQYLGTIENAGYSWLFIDDFAEITMDNFDPKANMAPRNEIPNTASLRSMVGKSVADLKPNEKADQQFILGEFLKYAKMAEHMFLVTQGTNYDTSTFNDPYLLFKKHEQLVKARQTIISSVDEILDNSFIGITAETLNKTRDGVAQILASDKSKVRNVIQRVLKPYVDMNDRDFVKLAQKAVADLFDYAVQTNTEFKNIVTQTMISDGGYANDIMQMIKEIKANPNHPLFDNHVVNIIVPQLAPEASPESANNIKIKGATNKIYDQNSIIYSFRELKEYLESTGDIAKYNKFKTLALYQSGLSVNRLSFTSLLPFEDFEDIYNDTIQKLESLDNLETFADLNVFERNNWGNDDIVPYEKARWIRKKDGTMDYNPAMKYLPKKVQSAVENNQIPPIISVSVLGRKSNSDFFVYSWEDAGITKEKKAEMRKKGDFSYIKRGLFRKVKNNGKPFVHTSNGKDYYIYQAVNAWGARERAQEFYDVEKKSKIDNGFIKVDNVAADERIINIFTGGKAATVAKTKASKEVSILLKNGKTYPSSKINSKMLEVIGYNPEQIGKILKSLC
jgi:2-hydroxy-3-keto-5-methylthiopentenyl-1-phosphate phosphatase